MASIRSSATRAHSAVSVVDLNLVAHLAGHQALEDPGQVRRVDAGHGRAGADQRVEADDGLVG
jgi:hypothetical protein